MSWDSPPPIAEQLAWNVERVLELEAETNALHLTAGALKAENKRLRMQVEDLEFRLEMATRENSATD